MTRNLRFDLKDRMFIVGGCRSIFTNQDDIEMISKCGDEQTYVVIIIIIKTKTVNGVYYVWSIGDPMSPKTWPRKNPKGCWLASLLCSLCKMANKEGENTNIWSTCFILCSSLSSNVYALLSGGLTSEKRNSWLNPHPPFWLLIIMLSVTLSTFLYH